MDNVYECIEKLEMGRSHSHNGVQHDPGPIVDIKEALCNIFIGTIGLILYVMSNVQVKFHFKPFLVNLRNFNSLTKLLSIFYRL